MERVIRITAVPAEEVHPDHVIAAIEANIERIDGARLRAQWIDACPSVGAAELVIRVEVELSAARTVSSIEAALVDELCRRRLRATVTVDLAGPTTARPPGSGSGRGLPDDGRSPAQALAALRDDVRRLIHLIPIGRVTTVTTIAAWTTSDPWRIASTIDGLAVEHRLPWHRVTDRGGQLDTLQDGARLRAQSARLEAERVPVRHACVIGFDRYFIDIARLPGRHESSRYPNRQSRTGTTRPPRRP